MRGHATIDNKYIKYGMLDNISLFGCRIGIGERHVVVNDAKRQQWIIDIGGAHCM